MKRLRSIAVLPFIALVLAGLGVMMAGFALMSAACWAGDLIAGESGPCFGKNVRDPIKNRMGAE